MMTLSEILNLVKDIFDHETFTGTPKELYEPIEYTMHLGGKRLRPAMLIAANQMFGGDTSQVRSAAIGIETFHNFTLLHDDLMDKSPLRRGMPTVYCKWDQNTAILSGDTMLSLATKYILAQNHPNFYKIVSCFNETAIGVYEGQQYDMNFETRTDVTIPEYMEMIRLKTAVLLAGALKLGALYTSANDTDIAHLYSFGTHFGLAFQLQDDLLDAYGDVKVLGKQTGQDILDNKKTFLYLKALENTPQHQKLFDIFNGKHTLSPDQKIKQVLDIYNEIEIKKTVENHIEAEFKKALDELNAIDLPQANKQPLVELTQTQFGRKK